MCWYRGVALTTAYVNVPTLAVAITRKRGEETLTDFTAKARGEGSREIRDAAALAAIALAIAVNSFS